MGLKRQRSSKQLVIARTIDQAVSASTDTAVIFSTEAAAGPTKDLSWSSGTNPTRMTVQRRGLFLLEGNLPVVLTPSGQDISVWIRYNGSSVPTVQRRRVGGGTTEIFNLTCTQEAVVGDYFELVVNCTLPTTISGGFLLNPVLRGIKLADI